MYCESSAIMENDSYGLVDLYEADDSDSETDSGLKERYQTLIHQISSKLGDVGYGPQVSGSINVINIDQRKDDLLKSKKTSYDHDPILSRSEVADLYHSGRSENFIKAVNLLSSDNNLLTIEKKLLKRVIEPVIVEYINKKVISQGDFPTVIDQDGLVIGPLDDIKSVFDKIGLIYKIKTARMPASFEDIKSPPSVSGEFKIAVRSFDKDGNPTLANTIVPVNLGNILPNRYKSPSNLADGEERKINNRLNKFSASEPDIESVKSFLGGDLPDFVESTDDTDKKTYKSELEVRQKLINSLIRQLYSDLRNYKNVNTLKSIKDDDMDILLGSKRGGSNEDSFIIEQGTMALCEAIKHLLYTKLKNLCKCNSPTEMYKYISLKEVTSTIRTNKVKLLNQSIATVGPAQIILLLPWLHDYLSNHYIDSQRVNYVYLAAIRDDNGNLVGGRSTGRTLEAVISVKETVFDTATNKAVTIETIRVPIPGRKVWYQLDNNTFEIVKGLVGKGDNKKWVPLEFGPGDRKEGSGEKPEPVSFGPGSIYQHFDVWPMLYNLDADMIARNVVSKINKDLVNSNSKALISKSESNRIYSQSQKAITGVHNYLEYLVKKEESKTFDNNTDIGMPYIVAVLNCLSEARTIEDVEKFIEVGTSLESFLALSDSNPVKVSEKVKIENVIKLAISYRYKKGPEPLCPEESESIMSRGKEKPKTLKTIAMKSNPDIVIKKQPDKVLVKPSWVRSSQNWPILRMAYEKYTNNKKRLSKEIRNVDDIINQTLAALKNVDVRTIKSNIANVKSRKASLIDKIPSNLSKDEREKALSTISKQLSKSKDGYVGFLEYQLEPVYICAERIKNYVSDAKISIRSISEISGKGKFDLARYIGFLNILYLESTSMIKNLSKASDLMTDMAEGEPVLGDKGERLYLPDGTLLRGERDDYQPKVKENLKNIENLLSEAATSAQDKVDTIKELINFMIKRPDLIKIYKDDAT